MGMAGVRGSLRFFIGRQPCTVLPDRRRDHRVLLNQTFDRDDYWLIAAAVVSFHQFPMKSMF
jgi:hypothetical protein